MGDTVEAIAHKADVPSRVRASVTGTIDGVRDRAVGATNVVRENPLGLFFGAAAIGFLFGSLLPATRLEERRLGPIGDQLKEQARERVQETVNTVRDVATQSVAQMMS